MSFQGIVLLDVFGFAVILLILDLVRRQRLNVAYAVVWVGSTLAMMSMISIPPLLDLVTRAVGALFPASALSLLAFGLIFVILIFFSVKLSQLSARQTALIQRLALDGRFDDKGSARGPDAGTD